MKVVTEHLSPFQIVKNNGNLDGYSVDVISQLFALTQDTPQTQVLPWARAYKTALTEPNVLIYSLIRNREREDKFHWVGQLTTQRIYIWGLRSKFPQPFDSIEQAKEYRISTPQAYTTAAYLERNDFKHVYLTGQYEQNIGMLLKDRIDLIISSPVVLHELAKKKLIDSSQLVPLIEVTELESNVYVALSKGSDSALVSRYQKQFERLVTLPIFEQIKAKWQVD
ncbi:transporter substrate-binding domain-containing protein [Psychrobium sp. 1_MG-2023]|nr:transporter substrate-binding domain-containing protein [Psychrobium sp. 1_MG-2023]MDP2562523.1 transporter substrate-binding domain-containing protein [Psychrobium sp. 1_MG-2023]